MLGIAAPETGKEQAHGFFSRQWRRSFWQGSAPAIIRRVGCGKKIRERAPQRRRSQENASAPAIAISRKKNGAAGPVFGPLYPF